MIEKGNSNIVIRLAKDGDAATIASLLHDSFFEYRSLYTEKAFVATTLAISKIQQRIDDRTIWVALLENVISGTISLLPVDGGLYIKSVAVAPAARGKGLGKTLMKHAEHEALKMNLRSVELTTTLFLFEAIKLYDSLGFEPFGFEDLYGTELIKMKKNLKPGTVLLENDNSLRQ